MNGAMWCNRRWHEILGLDYNLQRVQSIERFKNYIHPDDADHATQIDFEELQGLIARGEPYTIEFRIIHQDGNIRWIRSVASLIPGTEQALRAVGCITDITSLKSPQPAILDAKISAQEPLRALSPAPTDSQDENAGLIALSEREAECLRLVSFGKTAKETAFIIGRSPRTVEFHLNKAIKKLNAVNKFQAAFLAFQRNLLR